MTDTSRRQGKALAMRALLTAMFVVAWVGGGLVGYVTWVRFVLMAECWPKWVLVVTLVLLVMGAGGAVAWSLWRRIHRRSDAQPAFLEERGL